MDMNSNMLPMLLMRVVIACFFGTGFVAFYQRLWVDAFENVSLSAKTKIRRRVMLVFGSAVLGTFLHLAAMMYMDGGETALIYHNWSLFVLLLPFLYQGFNWFEKVIQYIAIIMVWYMHHATNLFEPYPLFAGVVTLGMVLLMRRYRMFIVRHWIVGVILAFINASLFWTSAPAVSMGVHMTNNLVIEAVATFTLMIAFVMGYWMRQYREDEHRLQLEQLANYDTLTNAKTYSLYQREVTELFNNARTKNEPLTLVTLDIDRFKQVNDHYGHLAGNTILIGVASTIDKMLGEVADNLRIYRTGGEEFNIVFPGKTVEDVFPIVETCWQAVRKSEYGYNERRIAVTISVGMTEVKPEDKTIDDTYKRADDSLYKSKRSGRDAISVDQETRVVNMNTKEDFVASYAFFTQGIYDIQQKDRPRVGNELLLRTYDQGQNRWVLPDDFEIPHDLQIMLMKRVLESTTANNITVNLTAVQFKDRDVANALTEFAMKSTTLDQLTVEITDITNLTDTRGISAVYRAANVQILIDDVGSDNSFELVRDILTYVDGVKFAMQNLRTSNTQEQLQSRIQFWCQVAQDNDLIFILEGVETISDLKYAEKMGIQYLQGYHFGKPALPSVG